jgi:protein TonB
MEPANRFSRCLLEQNDERSRQAKRLRRRTVLIAILIQAAALSLLILRPLFGASAEKLRIARLVPGVPWKGSQEPREPGRHRPATPPGPHLSVLVWHVDRWPAAARPDVDVNLNCADAPDISPDIDAPMGPGFGDPNGLLRSFGSSSQGLRLAPPPPQSDAEAPPRKPKLVPPNVQQALLITRVEPVYPVLAKQIRLEGTVVIRAIIAENGAVESAEILSGHPLLARAARDAILEWRYRPTLLRGEPIEVETLVTVIFRMQ